MAPPPRTFVQVNVAGRQVRQAVAARHITVELEAENLPETQFSFRLFRPGPEVLDALWGDVLERARAGDRKAAGKVAALVAEAYLQLRTSRRISTWALSAGGVVRPGDDPMAIVDAAVRESLPEEESLEDQLMLTLVGQACAEAGSLLPTARRLSRTIINHVVALDWAGFAKIREAGVSFTRRLPLQERRLRHSIHQVVRRRLPKDPTLREMVAMTIRSAHQTLIDQANRLTLKAMIEQIGLTEPEQRAFKFYRLKRRSPTRPVSGWWFDGIITDHPFLAGLLAMCPSVSWRLVVTVFFRAWPTERLQVLAEQDLRHYLHALLVTGRMFLSSVQEEERSRKAIHASSRPHRSLARAGERAQQLAFLQRHRRRLTGRQREVLELRIHLSTKDTAEQLGITMQAVRKHLADAAARIKRLQGRSTRPRRRRP